VVGSTAAGSVGAGHRVLLVRGWGDAGGSGGRCGGADGTAVRVSHHGHLPARGPTPEARRSAAVYRALRERFPALEITVVDARNWAWLGPAVYRDARRSGRDRRASVREAAWATTPGCLVVGGEVVLDRRPPTPAEAVAEVARRTRWPRQTGE
jgi:hypothetical protein